MHPLTPVVFIWSDRRGRRQTLNTTYQHFKNYAIEFAEDEQLDVVFDVYYTIGDVTKKLDYYNTEL
jgi:hypothetical protein